ncbi:MAG: DUF3467 domain-containing protein [bacterium]
MAQEQRQQTQGQGQQQQIQIKITDDILKGAISNMMAVSHTKEEFVIDFMNIYPAQGQGIVTARVVVTPGHIKRIVNALTENVQRYEKQFGKIEESSAPEQDFGFKPE